MIVETYKFDPPIYVPATGAGVVGTVTEVDIERVEEDYYDLYDQDGYCLNEGCPLVFVPSKAQVREWVETGKIAGEYE